MWLPMNLKNILRRYSSPNYCRRFPHCSSAHLCPESGGGGPEPASSARLSACSPSRSPRSARSRAMGETPLCRWARSGTQSLCGNPPRYPWHLPHQRPLGRLLSDLHPLKRVHQKGLTWPNGTSSCAVKKGFRGDLKHIFLYLLHAPSALKW